MIVIGGTVLYGLNTTRPDRISTNDMLAARTRGRIAPTPLNVADDIPVSNLSSGWVLGTEFATGC